MTKMAAHSWSVSREWIATTSKLRTLEQSVEQSVEHVQMDTREMERSAMVHTHTHTHTRPAVNTHLS